MNVEIAKCCLTCVRFETIIIAQKKKDNIYTGHATHGRCYNKNKMVEIYNVCNKLELSIPKKMNFLRTTN